MRTLKINQTHSGKTFYGTPIGVGPNNTVLFELDQSYEVRGLTFKHVSLDIDSGAAFSPEYSGLSDYFILETVDLPRLQEAAMHFKSNGPEDGCLDCGYTRNDGHVYCERHG